MAIIVVVALLATRVEPILSAVWIDLDLLKPVQSWLTAIGLGQNLASWVAIGVSIRLAEWTLGFGLGAIIGFAGGRKHWWTAALMLAVLYVSIQELEFYVSIPASVYTGRHTISYVFSFIFAPCVLGGAWLGSRTSKPVRDGFCNNCDYDLTGNVSGVCPECGTPIGEIISEQAVTSTSSS